MKILIVDDDSREYEWRREELEKEGHTVDVAEDYQKAEEALKKAGHTTIEEWSGTMAEKRGENREEQFQLILLDMCFKSGEGRVLLDESLNPIEDLSSFEDLNELEEIENNQGNLIHSYLLKTFIEADLPSIIMYSRTENNYRHTFSRGKTVNFLDATSARVGADVFDYLLDLVERNEQGVNIGRLGGLEIDFDPLLVRALDDRMRFYRSRFDEFFDDFIVFIRQRGIKAATAGALWTFEQKFQARYFEGAEFDHPSWLSSLKDLVQRVYSVSDLKEIYQPQIQDYFPFWTFGDDHSFFLVPHPSVLDADQQSGDLESWLNFVQEKLEELQDNPALPNKIDLKWQEFPLDAPPSKHLKFPIFRFEVASEISSLNFQPWFLMRESLRKRKEEEAEQSEDNEAAKQRMARSLTELREAREELLGMLSDFRDDDHLLAICHPGALWLAEKENGFSYLFLPLFLEIFRDNFFLHAKKENSLARLDNYSDQYLALLFLWIKGRLPEEIGVGWTCEELETFRKFIFPGEGKTPQIFLQIEDYFSFDQDELSKVNDDEEKVVLSHLDLKINPRYLFPLPPGVHIIYLEEIVFHHCTFILPKTVPKVSWQNENFSQDITFRECSFRRKSGEGELLLRFENCQGQISIVYDAPEKEPNLKNLVLKEFHGQLTLSNLHVQDTISIEKGKIQELNIDRTKASRLKIHGKREDLLSLEKAEIRNCSFEEVQFAYTHLTLFFYGRNYCTGRTEFKGVVFEEIQEDKNGRYLHNSFDYLGFNECKFKSDMVSISPIRIVTLKFSEVEAKHIQLFRMNLSDNLYVESKTKKLGKISVKQSHMGMMEFEIYNSLEELYFEHCEWERKLIIKSREELKSKHENDADSLKIDFETLTPQVKKMILKSSKINDIKADGVFFGECNFSDLTAVGVMAFQKAWFQGKVDFSPSQEQYHVHDEDEDIDSVCRAIFKDLADFNNATFDKDADFSEAYFDGRCKFHDAEFKQGASFRYAVFAEGDMRDVIFHSNPDFWGALFRQGLELQGARFLNKDSLKLIHFDQAVVEGTLNFSEADFGYTVDDIINIPSFLGSTIREISGLKEHFIKIITEVDGLGEDFINGGQKKKKNSLPEESIKMLDRKEVPEGIKPQLASLDEDVEVHVLRRGQEWSIITTKSKNEVFWLRKVEKPQWTKVEVYQELYKGERDYLRRNLTIKKFYDLLSRKARMFELQAIEKNEIDLADKLYFESRELSNKGTSPSKGWLDEFLRYTTEYGTNWKRAFWCSLVIPLVVFLILLAITWDFQKGCQLAIHVFLLETPDYDYFQTLPIWFQQSFRGISFFIMFFEVLLVNFFIVILARKGLKS